MKEKLNDIIETSLQEFKTEIQKDETTQKELKAIKGRIINKVKLVAKSELDLDLINKPDKKLLQHIEKQVDNGISDLITITDEDKEELKIDSNSNILDVIKSLEKETKKINKLENKGNHKEATVRSGRLIRKIKEEIEKIKQENLNAKDLDNLEKIEILLDEQLEWHKTHLKSRYKKEFLDEEATFKAIITVLPKGIGIQTKRVVNCINQIKEAKSNKERIFKILELGKEMGVLVLTPVTFTVKFIIKHWYLLLLLLSLLWPKWPGGKKPKKDKDPKERLEPELQPEYAEEPAYQPVQVPETDPVIETIPVLDPETDPLKNPGTVPKPSVKKPINKPVIANEPVAIADGGLAKEPVVEHKPAIDYAHDPRFTAPATQPVVEVDAVTGADPVVAKPQTETKPFTVMDAEKGRIPITEPAPQPVENINMEPLPEVPQPQPGPAPQPVATPAPAPTPAPAATPRPVTQRPRGKIESAMPLIPDGAIKDADTCYNMVNLVNGFIDTIAEYNYYLINHSKAIIVHNSEEFVEAVRNTPDWSFFADKIDVASARQYYKDITRYSYLPGKQSIIWIENGTDIMYGGHYFADEKELAEYILSGADPVLQQYHASYMSNNGIADYNEIYRSVNATTNNALGDFCQTLGVTAEVGVGLFCLYELAKLGLAIPTYGATLALP